MPSQIDDKKIDLSLFPKNYNEFTEYHIRKYTEGVLITLFDHIKTIGRKNFSKSKLDDMTDLYDKFIKIAYKDN